MKPTKSRKKKPTPDSSIAPATLVAWRTMMELSQREACEALGCSRAALNNWEHGTTICPKYIGLAMTALELGFEPYGA
jgi:DNA-binding transcriptional regulator YiaG